MKHKLPLLALILAACASKPPQPAAPVEPTQPLRYSSESGPSPVGVIPVATIHDAQRNRDLRMNIEYPTRGGGPFPLIIFSHGFGGASNGYEGLASYWASYGYVVVRPDHADAGALRDLVRDRMLERAGDQGDRRQQRDRSGTREARATREREDERMNVAETVWQNQREPQWRDRVRDVTLIIDSLDEIERRYPELAYKIDHKRIGVGGHSYGAFTAMLVSGARTSGADAVGGADPRVKAVVAMSPQGIGGPQNLTAESWRDVRMPVMYMTGTRDVGANNETPDWRRAGFENSPAGDKYLLVIEGARHMSFAGAMGITPEITSVRDDPNYPIGGQPRPGDPYGRDPLSSPTTATSGGGIVRGDRNIFSTIRMASLTFWDAYLKDEAKAKESLRSDVRLFAGTTLTRK